MFILTCEYARKCCWGEKLTSASFGPSLLTREGRSWRAHQRIVGPTFTERNAELVWTESIAQATQMLSTWTVSGTQSPGIPDIRADTMQLPFNVINMAGFGVNLPWATSHSSTALDGPHCKKQNLPGYKLSYHEALHALIARLFHIIVFPKWVLKCTPSSYARELLTTHTEAVGYLHDLIVSRERELRHSRQRNDDQVNFDLMSALVATKLEHQERSQGADGEDSVEDEEALTEKAILANVFLMMIAGHETTATILLMTLVELTIDLAWQQALQAEIDQILGDRPHRDWNFNEDASILSGGKVGATVNEVLRLYPPANVIPKGTRKNSPQILRKGPHEFTVPASTAVQILTVSTHHNPRHWRVLQVEPDIEADLQGFQPRRWLQSNSKMPSAGRAVIDSSENASILPTESEVSSTFKRPPAGAYIPFSHGHRGCIGRRFAQVELLAVIAVIFKDYSLELDVSEYADDDSVQQMGLNERRAIYDSMRKNTRLTARRGMRHHLTMQQKTGNLPLRLVKRGEEQFFEAYPP